MGNSKKSIKPSTKFSQCQTYESARLEIGNNYFFRIKSSFFLPFKHTRPLEQVEESGAGVTEPLFKLHVGPIV